MRGAGNFDDLAVRKERGREHPTAWGELCVLFERGDKDRDFYLCELVDPMLVAGPIPRGVPLTALPLGGCPYVWLHSQQRTPQCDLFRIVHLTSFEGRNAGSAADQSTLRELASYEVQGEQDEQHAEGPLHRSCW